MECILLANKQTKDILLLEVKIVLTQAAIIEGFPDIQGVESLPLWFVYHMEILANSENYANTFL